MDLNEINRIHDDQPTAAAQALRALDATQLPADDLALLAFLLNHVLGEKLDAWDEAAARLEALRASRGDAPLALLVQAAVAERISGRTDGSAGAVLAATAPAPVAECAVALEVLAFRPPPFAELARQLSALAGTAAAFDAPNPLDRRLGIGFNNATSQLLEMAPAEVDAEAAEALVAGAAQALRFWRRVGTWVHHERALYLQAVVFNRTRNFGAASAAAQQGLDLIAAHGSEDVDRAFLLLQLAGALAGLGDRAGGDVLAQARAVADGWDDDGLRDWFATEHDRLFARRQEARA